MSEPEPEPAAARQREYEQSGCYFLRNTNSEPGFPARQREYEQSGCYPAQGKPFRLWALLGWLSLVVLLLAGVAALLNFILLG